MIAQLLLPVHLEYVLSYVIMMVTVQTPRNVALMAVATPVLMQSFQVTHVCCSIHLMTLEGLE